MKLVVCCGMPRAGSHLQWQIVEDIVHLVEPKAPSREGIRKCGPLLKQERPGYAVVKIHRYWPQTLPFHPKVITCCRDPRGLAASRMHLGWSIEQVLHELPKWIEYFDQWTAVPGALAMRYESMIKSLDRTALHIARWLDIPLSKEQVQEVATGSALSRHRVHHVHRVPGHAGITHSSWEKDLTKEQQDAVVWTAREFMLRTGYLKEGQTA